METKSFSWKSRSMSVIVPFITRPDAFQRHWLLPSLCPFITRATYGVTTQQSTWCALDQSFIKHIAYPAIPSFPASERGRDLHLAFPRQLCVGAFLSRQPLNPRGLARGQPRQSPRPFRSPDIKTYLEKDYFSITFLCCVLFSFVVLRFVSVLTLPLSASLCDDP